MCLPAVPLVLGALAAGGATAKYVESDQAWRMRDATMRENRMIAKDQANRSRQSLESKRQDFRLATGQEIASIKNEAAMVTGAGEAATAAAGVGGAALFELLHDIEKTRAQKIAVKQHDIDAAEKNINLEEEGVRQKYYQRLLQNQPGNRPSPWLAAFTIAASGVGGYAAGGGFAPGVDAGATASGGPIGPSLPDGSFYSGGLGA